MDFDDLLQLDHTATTSVFFQLTNEQSLIMAQSYKKSQKSVLREDSPQRATTHKGKIRIALEQKLEAAAHQGMRSVILRLGDFFGPKAGNNWFSQGLVKPNQPVTSIVNPGAKGIGHAWCYLPDAGETFAQLMDREAELSNFERFHFRGHWDKDGSEMIAAIRRAAGNKKIPERRLSWWLFRLASPFNETLREVYATRPLWRTPIELDNTRLVGFIGNDRIHRCRRG
jgi:nucleoside-diphosphate-sugar epimerase